jgi:hypothetical protein
MSLPKGTRAPMVDVQSSPRANVPRMPSATPRAGAPDRIPRAAASDSNVYIHGRQGGVSLRNLKRRESQEMRKTPDPWVAG